ncbi:MAG: hypothetical protein ACOY3U_01600 [Bacillota bacterium]
MWSVDDEIRDMIKEVSARVHEPAGGNPEDVKSSYEAMKNKVSEMIFKEENILTPMMMETLTEEEWVEVKQQDEEFGVVFSRPHGDFWQPKAGQVEGVSFQPAGDDALPLDTGFLTLKQINAVLTNVPRDIFP